MRRALPCSRPSPHSHRLPARRVVGGVVCGLLLFGGCIDVTDLREQDIVELPSGQVDTGWAPDVFSTDLPSDFPCETDDECVDWRAGRACVMARCEASICVAEPVADGQPCSDSNPTTRGDRCEFGSCIPGAAVCVCSVDSECDLFDDGNQCNGRLRCDGCACLPMDTPPGTSCNDQNPATADDVCIDESTCEGTIPCQCESVADCPTQSCTESLCDSCQCRLYAGVDGLIYDGATPEGALPEGWSTDSDNAAMTWRPSGGVGLRAGGEDDTYDHGAARVEVRTQRVGLPPGAAVARWEIGLQSAETGCDDRLEIYSDDTLLDTLCGTEPLQWRTWALPAGDSSTLRAVFISDDDENDAAGAFVGGAIWIRSEPDNCPLPSVERVLPVDPIGAQMHPDVSVGTDGFLAVWEGPEGVLSRPVSSMAEPVESPSVVDAAGRSPAAGGGWIAWENTEEQAIHYRGAGGVMTVPDPDPAHSPDIDGNPVAVAYLAATQAGDVPRVYWNDQIVDLGPPTGSAWAPQVLVADDEALVLVSDHNSVRTVIASAPETSASVIFDASAAGRPSMDRGHGRIAAAVPTASGIFVGNETGGRTIDSTGAGATAIAATQVGWIVVWTVRTDGESGLMALALVPDLSVDKALTAATYTFGDQDEPRIIPDGSDALAVWRTAWMDGDPSGVVVRRISFPSQVP